ncbi:MAG: FAD binding domain-containing protein [Acidimicrobiales bacterium]
MFLKPFRYARAADVAEACDLLRREEGSKVLAGGQSLLPLMHTGLVEPELLVDISHIADMTGLSRRDGYLELGALTRHAELASSRDVRAGQPLLAQAASHVGNPRVRNRGTIGGSLAHADPAAELPLALTALGATLVATDGSSAREIKSDELALSYLSTQLAPDEIVTRVRVPVLGPGWGWSFSELSRRTGDFAIVAVAVLLRSADGCVLEARVAAAGVGARPTRLGGVEAALSGATRAELQGRIGDVPAVSAEVDPVSDGVASADYRRHLLTVLVRRGIDQAFARSEGQ